MTNFDEAANDEADRHAQMMQEQRKEILEIDERKFEGDNNEIND